MSSIVEVPTRKALADIDPEELRQWLMKRRQLLTYHKRLVQRYLDRRQRQRGNRKPTHTDRQYSRFQTLAGDGQRSALACGAARPATVWRAAESVAFGGLDRPL
jgi:hypothetical protein